MPTEKPRVTFTISEEKLSEINEYRFDNKIKNQTQAILALIEKGLADYIPEKEKSPSTLDEEPEALQKIRRIYNSLNETGKGELLSYAEFLDSRIDRHVAPRESKNA